MAPNEQKRAVHALNRLTFGPRPGEVQQVMAMGVDRWIDMQLHPDKIPDTAMEARLAPLRTLHMSAKEIVEEFPDNADGQAGDGRQEVRCLPIRRGARFIACKWRVCRERLDRKKEAQQKGQSSGQHKPRRKSLPQQLLLSRPPTIAQRLPKNWPPRPAGDATQDPALTAQ